VEDFAAENVVYLEIRTTPKVVLWNILLHTALQFISVCSGNLTGNRVVLLLISSRTMQPKG
jgi:hypothetical protein